MLTEQGISPEIYMPEEPVMWKADQGALQRVFTNILSNAAKYSYGALKITLEKKGYITFKNRAQRLSEVETGKLFDRFYTMENAKGSTGLGLSIARLLTEKMGGSITASWNVGYLVISLCFPFI